MSIKNPDKVGSTTEATLTNLRSIPISGIQGIENSSAVPIFNVAEQTYKFYAEYDVNTSSFSLAKIAGKSYLLQEEQENGTSAITWSAPASISSSYTIFLPSDAPLANQALFVTDTDGNTEWRSVSSLEVGTVFGVNEFAIFNINGEYGTITDSGKRSLAMPALIHRAASQPLCR